MDEAVQNAVSRQIGKELYAGYFYLAISAHFDRESLLGFSKWMRAQAREELTHAMKLFDFMNHRDATPHLEAIPAPPSEFGPPLGIFETALAHEPGRRDGRAGSASVIDPREKPVDLPHDPVGS